jgi:hypothetical protein
MSRGVDDKSKRDPREPSRGVFRSCCDAIEPAQHDRCIVLRLAPRPAVPVWVGVFRGPDLADQLAWPCVPNEGGQRRPGRQPEAVDQPSRPVAEQDGGHQRVDGNRAGNRVRRRGRLRAGHPEATRPVPPPSCRDHVSPACICMFAAADRGIVHVSAIGLPRHGLPIVGQHDGFTGPKVEEQRRVREHQVLNFAPANPDCHDSRRRRQWVAEIACLHVARSYISDGRSEAVCERSAAVRLDLSQQRRPERTREPCNSVSAPRLHPGWHTSAVHKDRDIRPHSREVFILRMVRRGGGGRADEHVQSGPVVPIEGSHQRDVRGLMRVGVIVDADQR